MKLFTNKKQAYIFAAAGAVAIIFACARGIPMQKAYADIKNKAGQQESINGLNSKNIATIDTLKKQYAQLHVHGADFDLRVPKGRDLGNFLQQITKIMSDLRLQDQLVAPGTDEKADDVTCIPLNMKCKGKLADIFAFYQALNNMPRLIRIEQVTLSSSQDDIDILMETKAVIFYR